MTYKMLFHQTWNPNVIGGISLEWYKEQLTKFPSKKIERCLMKGVSGQIVREYNKFGVDSQFSGDGREIEVGFEPRLRIELNPLTEELPREIIQKPRVFLTFLPDKLKIKRTYAPCGIDGVAYVGGSHSTIDKTAEVLKRLGYSINVKIDTSSPEYHPAPFRLPPDSPASLRECEIREAVRETIREERGDVFLGPMQRL